jgi:hypothetical protein
MTTTEAETTTKRRPTAARNEGAGSLSVDLLEAGSAFAERSVRLARSTAEVGLKAGDALVVGSLGVAEEWFSSTPLAGLTVPPVKVARETWSTTSEGLRELVAAL